jgi:two-component system, NtrC family, nitrogen regulation sensor histidine kinase GlnL
MSQLQAAPHPPIRHADLLDALSASVLLLDFDYTVLYINNSAQEFLGLSRSQALGHAITDLFTEAPALMQLLQRAVERGDVCSEHELMLTPIVNGHGPRPAVVADVTVTRVAGPESTHRLLLELVDARLRMQLTRESELLARVDSSRLIARQLAHEIRNPLGGLRGAAQLLSRELNVPSMREYTDVIMREADRLGALVNTMLGPSRPPQREKINIHEVCEHVYQLLRAEAPEGVQLARDYDPSIPDAQLARDELIQALLNVMRNAVQAVGRSGRVLLRTRSLSNVTISGKRHRLVCCLQVEDDGPGVPDEMRKTLFLPLVSSKSDGTGLGLSVAQDMLARQRGIIEFESAPGRTVFSLLLPMEGYG